MTEAATINQSLPKRCPNTAVLSLLLVLSMLLTTGRIAATDDASTYDEAEVQAHIEALKRRLEQKEATISELKSQLESLQATLNSRRQQAQAMAEPEAEQLFSKPVQKWLLVGVLSMVVLSVIVTTMFLWRRRALGQLQPRTCTDEPATNDRRWFSRNGDRMWLPGGSSIAFTTALAVLYIPTGLVRGMMISLLPLLVLDMLGTAQRVSVLYLGVGVGGIVVALLLPKLIRSFGDRRVFQLGGAMIVVSMCVLTVAKPAWLLAGMLLHVFGVACLEMSLVLFLLTALKREHYKYFEGMRVACAASGFVVGPVLSIGLYDHVSPVAPFMLTLVFALIALAYARRLGLGERVTADAPMGSNPFTYMKRFLAQPRLVLAWSLSLCRYTWWVMFFIYVPIYASSSGLGGFVGGIIVSVGTAATIFAPAWGRLGRRIGLRQLYTIGFASTGVASVVAFATAGFPAVCAVVLVVSAVLASLPDGASHIPFYRAARSRERAEMSGVYATHRETGQLLPPGLFSLLLKFMPLPAVFISGGLMMLVMTTYCRYLPRRM
ncbi:MAG: hypothetical protein CMO26_01925 [Thiotrichales bacterium]|nr:hypothetical protein [Thiotrichales bacterium]